MSDEVNVGILIPVMRPEKIRPLIENVKMTSFGTKLHWMCELGSLCHRTLVELHEDVLTDSGGSWGERLNALYQATTEAYFFTGSDDIVFHPSWLLKAAIANLTIPGQVGGVIAVNDLYNPRGTHALVSRSYIEEMSGCVDVPGVVIHPSYHHNYSESELFETAKSRGRFVYAEDAIVEHMHPAARKGEWDDVYDAGLSYLAADRAFYESRKHLWGQ